MHSKKLALITAAFPILCSVYLTTRGAIIASPHAARVQAQSSSAPLPPSDKPVEEVRKNIKALQGLPDSQLILVMQFMSASLGVNCAFCHVREGNEWVFDKDDKKEKQTARQMIRMTREINRTTFNGKLEVSCFTCHRGSDHPVSAVSLPVAPAPAAGPGAAARDTKPLPAAAEVLKKFEDAIGGRAATLKAQSRMSKGTLVDGQGNSFPVEVIQKAPDKMVVSVTLPQGSMARAVEGSRGWIKMPQGGVRDARAAEIAQLKRIADIHWAAKLVAATANLEVLRKEKIRDRDAYVLRLPIDAASSERLYFDAENGLLLRRVFRTDTMIAPLVEQLDFADYRDVGGVKVPFEIKASGVDPRGDFTLKYSEVTPDVSLDDSRFRRP